MIILIPAGGYILYLRYVLFIIYIVFYYVTTYYVILMFMTMCPTDLEKPVVLDMAVLGEFVLGWGFSGILKIGLIMGSSNSKNQLKMGFSGSSRGVVGGVVENLVFG